MVIDGILIWRRGWMGNKYTIHQPRFQARRPSHLITCVPKNGLLSKDEIAKFLTKTERNESKNTQNTLLDVCFLLFLEYLQEKTPVFIS